MVYFISLHWLVRIALYEPCPFMGNNLDQGKCTKRTCVFLLNQWFNNDHRVTFPKESVYDDTGLKLKTTLSTILIYEYRYKLGVLIPIYWQYFIILLKPYMFLHVKGGKIKTLLVQWKTFLYFFIYSCIIWGKVPSSNGHLQIIKHHWFMLRHDEIWKWDIFTYIPLRLRC